MTAIRRARPRTTAMPASSRTRTVPRPSSRSRIALARARSWLVIAGRPGSRADAQGFEAAQDEARLPGGLLDQLKARQPLEDPPEDDVELGLREGRPETVVDPGAEREVRVRVAVEDQLVGLYEGRGVAIGRRELEGKLLAA